MAPPQQPPYCSPASAHLALLPICPKHPPPALTSVPTHSPKAAHRLCLQPSTALPTLLPSTHLLILCSEPPCGPGHAGDKGTTAILTLVERLEPIGPPDPSAHCSPHCPASFPPDDLAYSVPSLRMPFLQLQPLNPAWPWLPWPFLPEPFLKPTHSHSPLQFTPSCCS